MHSCSGGNAAAVSRGLFVTPPDIAKPNVAMDLQPLGEVVSPEPPPPRV